MLAKFGCDRYFISGQVYFSGVEHLYQCRKAWRHMQVYDNTFVGAERHHQIIIVAHFLLSIYKIGGRTVKSTYTQCVGKLAGRMVFLRISFSTVACYGQCREDCDSCDCKKTSHIPARRNQYSNVPFSEIIVSRLLSLSSTRPTMRAGIPMDSDRAITSEACSGDRYISIL